jgi:MFS family permease
MFVTFALVERRAAEPIISLSLFRNSIFSVSVIATFLAGAGMFGAIGFLPLFIQGVMGESATNSGSVMTPLMVGFIVSAIISGQILMRTGRYKGQAISGFFLAALGMFLFSKMTATTSHLVVVRNMIVTGLGIGVSMSLFNVIVQNAFPRNRLGEVTASLQFFRSIGGTIGLAVLGSIMTNRFTSALQAHLASGVGRAVPAGQLAAVQNPQMLLAPHAAAHMQQSFTALGPRGQESFHQLMTAVQASLGTAITDLFMVGAGAMLLAMLAVCFLREIPLQGAPATEAVGEMPGAMPVAAE